jgi:thioredoxin reductase (NADPH)
MTGPDACRPTDAGEGGGQGEGPTQLPLETSLPGVFAAGDVRSGSIRRVASAVGEGAMAVRMVHEHLATAR